MRADDRSSLPGGGAVHHRRWWTTARWRSGRGRRRCARSAGSAASACPPRCRPTGCWRTAACWRRGRSRATTWRETAPARSRRRPSRARPRKPTAVAVSGIILELMEHARNPALVPLGCAIPSAELLAAGRLDRLLARAARVKGLDHNVYTDPRGDAQLRRELARRALRWGQALAPDDIVITCGCTEALTLALRPWRSRATPSPSSRPPTSACCTPSRPSTSRCWSCRRRPRPASISPPWPWR